MKKYEIDINFDNLPEIFSDPYPYDENFFLPLAMKVAAKTVAFDLVPVKPMAPPLYEGLGFWPFIRAGMVYCK